MQSFASGFAAFLQKSQRWNSLSTQDYTPLLNWSSEPFLGEEDINQPYDKIIIIITYFNWVGH
jgi:hypothetical protein